MTKQDILFELDKLSVLKTRKRLDMDKINRHIAGAKFFKDMDPVLLDDIHYITGTKNGFILSDIDIRFIINTFTKYETQPVASVVLSYSTYSGTFSGVYDLILKRELQGHTVFSTENVIDLATERAILDQVEEFIKIFIYHATERGYLVRAN